MEVGLPIVPPLAALTIGRRNEMLYYAAIFLIIAIIAAILGFGGIAGAAAGIAKVLFVVFLALFVVSLLFGRRPPTGA
jgi:uncharacterized membrane protein YtjA (UPF0391 family)